MELEEAVFRGTWCFVSNCAGFREHCVTEQHTGVVFRGNPNVAVINAQPPL